MSDEHSVDFLKKQYNMVPTQQSVQRKRKAWKVFGALFLAVAICGVLFSYNLAKEQEQTVTEYDGFSFFSSLRNLVGASDKTLTGEDDDRINVLLLGIGGYGHDGPELSDTIVFTSLKPSTGQIGMLSVPRDLAVPIPGYGYRRINSINAYGEMENRGSGAQWASEVIGDILDQNIHYYVKVDFDGFVDLVNAIGGVDLYVDRSFSDPQYPAEDDLVQTVTFQQGWMHMDGETALQYARSRHGNNGEGSDFARAKRQQKILVAVKDELLSASTFLNPGKLSDLIQTFQDNVQTNMSFWELMKLARYIPNIESDAINNVVLEAGYDSPLYSTTINGAYILLPKKDDWSRIQDMARTVFDPQQGATFSTESTQGESANSNKIILEIRNGTGLTGLAFQTSQLLAGTQFSVTQIGNADSSNYDTTIIYDLTGGKNPEELAILKNFLEAEVAMSTSGWVFSDTVVPRELTVETPQTEGSIDFLIILGENAANLVLQ